MKKPMPKILSYLAKNAKLLIILFLTILFTTNHRYAKSQEKKSDKIITIDGVKYYQHNVTKGQTLYYISKLYEISIDELKKHNPELSKGLFSGQIIKIPVDKNNQSSLKNENSQTIKHTVKSGETITSIAKKYNVSEKEILNENPRLSNENLKIGQEIKIPLKSKNEQQTIINQKNTEIYEIKQGETLTSIAKKFNISIEEIKNVNPQIEKNFKPGTKILIPIPTNKINQVNNETQPSKKNKTTLHVVKPKETIYQISKIYGITENDIYEANPEAKNGIQIGQELIIKLNEEQDETKIPINNKVTIDYVVKPGDNLYRIAKNNNTFVEDILAINPNLTEILTPGTIIKIPTYENKNNNVTNTANSDLSLTDTLYHKVKKQETLFGIARKYGKTVEQLLNLNPEAINTLKEDQLLIIEIRKKEISSNINNNTTTRQVTDCNTPSKKSEYSVGLLLPFNLSSINIDKIFQEDEEGILESESNTNIQRSMIIFDFYQGFLLSADTFVKQGTNLKLLVYDTEKDSTNIFQIIKKPDFQTLDLIIGPIFENDIKIILENMQNKSIPVVLPLTYYENYQKYSNVLQITPSNYAQIKETALYICNNFKGCNIIIVHNEKPQEITNSNIYKQIFNSFGMNYSEVIYNKEGHASLENKLNKDTNNIIIAIPTEQVFITNFLRKLNLETEMYKITLFAPQNIIRYSSIEFEYFNNLNIHIYSPFFIDYSRPDVKEFISKYREKYKTEPSRFAFQGFDTGTLIFKSLQKNGNNWFNCINNVSYNPLHTKFVFQNNNNIIENKYVNIYKFYNYDIIKVH